MSIDYDKFEPEDAKAQSRWGRELVTTHSASLGTGGDKYNGGGKQLKIGGRFGSLIILEVFAVLFNRLYWKFPIF